MSWIVAGLTVGSAIYKGFSAMGNAGDVATGKLGAQRIKRDKMNLLGDVKSQNIASAQGAYGESMQRIGLAGEVSESQFAGGQRDLSLWGQTGRRDIASGMRNVQQGAASAAARSGLATSGTVQEQTRMQMGQMQGQAGDLASKYKSDMTKLFETRDLAAKEREIGKSSAARSLEESKAEADLSYRSGEMSAEEAYQNTLTGLESTPTTFLEGIFG
jgi:hypothetical protein